jgi:hypothetical protein
MTATWPRHRRFDLRLDELSFVQQGRIGARVGDRDVTVEAGGFLFRSRAGAARPVEPDRWTGGLRGVHLSGRARTLRRRARAAAADRPLGQADLIALADRYDSPFHPELIPELVNTHGVHPWPPWTVGASAG